VSLKRIIPFLFLFNLLSFQSLAQDTLIFLNGAVKYGRVLGLESNMRIIEFQNGQKNELISLELLKTYTLNQLESNWTMKNNLTQFPSNIYTVKQMGNTRKLLDFVPGKYSIGLNFTTLFNPALINDFDLFIIEGNEFGSKSVEKRLEDRNEKSTKARQSALKRWGNKNNNANALQSESEPNAIKERKGKEIKEIKENYLLQKEKSFKLWILEDFQNDIKKYQNETSLDRNDLLAFYDYWRELTSNGKMKFQIEKTWQTDLRLKKWERGKNNFSKDVKKDNVKDMKSAALQAIFNNQ
jgi:hypothetical protein